MSDALTLFYVAGVIGYAARVIAIVWDSPHHDLPNDLPVAVLFGLLMGLLWPLACAAELLFGRRA